MNPTQKASPTLRQQLKNAMNGPLRILRVMAGVCALVLPGQVAFGSDLGINLLPADARVELTLTSGTGRWHRLEASANLIDWSALTTLYQTKGVSGWVDSDATGLPRRFYRSLQLTALDLYVAAPDTNASYTLLSTIPGAGQTTFILEMVSQAWLTTNEVNRTLWKHWMIIVKPTGATNPHSLLYISSGSNTSPSPPTSADATLRQIALDTRTVVTELRMVPNQPLTFVGETKSRSEDALIAYTWDKFLRTGDERWPARLPMTKAAVRAMDTVTAFCASPPGGGLAIDRFVVAGASKRGWTTWTTAVVDQRVVAIIPLVIDLLNLEPSFAHHYSAYGFWAPAIQDYAEMNIPDWFGTPQFRALLEIVDPYEYRQRLTLPKFLINATGDEFFLPDSAQFYFHDLPGVKYLRYVPNASHSLSGSDAWVSAKAFYQAILSSAALPRLSWTLQSSNTIRVVTGEVPTEVRLWQASNPDARDFRLDTIGRAWTSSVLVSQGGGVYVGTVAVPAQGWRAFFVELTYSIAGLAPLKFTTQVYVVPDILPYRWP